jgi:phage gpG-like protein
MSVRIKDNGDAFMRAFAQSIEEGLRAATLVGADSAAASMPGAGATGAQGRSGRLTYRPSFPGAPPGVNTGRLKNDIANARIGRFRWGFGTRVFYGRIHELGANTRTARFPERPFLRPALSREQSTMRSVFAQSAARYMARRGPRG